VLERLRFLALVLIVVGGCTLDDGGVPTPAPTGTSPEGVVLAYALAPGMVLVYDLELVQRLVLSTEGESAAVVDEDLPEEADLTITAPGRLTFTISDGPDDETYRVDIEGEFGDVEVDGTADGEEVDDPSDIEQLGAIQPVAATMVVDARGRVVDDPSAAAPAPAAPLSGLTGDLSRFVGPVLPDGPVAEGDSWTDTHSELVLGDEPVERTVTGTLAALETNGGVETMVIETESRTSAAEVDLAEFFAEFLVALAEESADAPDDVDRMLEQLVFRILIEPATSGATTRFDAARGVVIGSTTSGSTRLSMEAALPDEETGDIQRFDMRLDTDQTIEYSLVEGPGE
jgi:hypothetical protein